MNKYNEHQDYWIEQLAQEVVEDMDAKELLELIQSLEVILKNVHTPYH